MQDPVSFNEDSPVHELLAEVKSIIDKGGDLNLEKENLSALIEQADFLLGKYDQIYNEFIDVFTAMGGFDFSKRLQYIEPGDNFINFIVNGINMVNEELEDAALHRNSVHTLLNTLGLTNAIVIFTDRNGFIQLVNSSASNLPEFNEKLLLGQSINCLFSNYSFLEERIKEEGSVRNIKTSIKWLDRLYPATTHIAISITLGRIEGLMYVVQFPEIAPVAE